jgi:glycosyltransferase involved in cell wall biosynthesis
MTKLKSQKKIRVAVTYRVCQNWRTPIFSRLARQPDIELMVFHGQDIPGTKALNTKDYMGIPHTMLKSYHIPIKASGGESAWMLYPGIISHLNKFRPHVLLCEGGSNIFNNILVYFWAMLTRTPTIWWTLGYVPGRKDRGLAKIFRMLTNAFLHRSSVLLGYSSRAKRYFKEKRCSQPQFVAVNCVDTDRLQERIGDAQANPLPLRSRLGIEGKKVILFVGALTRPKRIDNLLHAYNELRRARQDVALLIVGDGDAREELEALANKLQLPDTHFAGRVIEDVSHYFLTGDVFVLPGLGGLAISEAMAHGLPVICTIADGCEEDLVVDGRNGLVVEDNDIPALTRAIETLLDDPDRLTAMKRASREMIEKQYNVHTYLQGILDAIRCAEELRCQKNTP